MHTSKQKFKYYPGYTFYPVCLNCGAVETLFSQIKHAIIFPHLIMPHCYHAPQVVSMENLSGIKVTTEMFRFTFESIH